MNCPMCNQPLREIRNDYNPEYPKYICSRVKDDEPIHYQKYFSSSWDYSQYEEYASLGNYRIVNYYSYKDGDPNVGTIQLIKYEGFYKIPETLVRITNIIPIPPKDKFLEKVKLYLLFS